MSSYNEQMKRINAALNAALDDDDEEDLLVVAPRRTHNDQYNQMENTNEDPLVPLPDFQSTQKVNKNVVESLLDHSLSEELEKVTFQVEETTTTTEVMEKATNNTEDDNGDFQDAVETISHLMKDIMKDATNKDEGNDSGSATAGDKVEATISRLVSQLSEPSGPDDDQPEETHGDKSEEELIKDLLNQFGGMGDLGDMDDLNADAMIDGMMEAMVSKELMYQPMKQIADSFPMWLENAELSSSERKRRQAQFKCFEELVHTYETDERNTKRLMELMQQAQEFGQPPEEIIQDIAPDLQLNEDGSPVLGETGLPFGEEDCVIM